VSLKGVSGICGIVDHRAHLIQFSDCACDLFKEMVLTTVAAKGNRIIRDRDSMVREKKFPPLPTGLPRGVLVVS